MIQDSTLDPGLGWFAVSLMGLLMMMQSVVVFVLLTKATTQLRAIYSVFSSLMVRVESGTIALRQLLSHMEGVPARLAEVQGKAPHLLAGVKGIITSVDEKLAGSADRSRSYLYQFDRAADTVLSNFSTQTFRVHRAVIHPAIRFSTLLQSVTAVASRVFREAESPASHSPDQEIFI